MIVMTCPSFYTNKPQHLASYRWADFHNRQLGCQDLLQGSDSAEPPLGFGDTCWVLGARIALKRCLDLFSASPWSFVYTFRGAP